MLSKIAMLDSAVIRAALLAVASLVGLILSYFGVDERFFSEQAGRVVDAVLLVLATGSTLYAAYARATKPTPPITDQAVARTMEMQRKQQGGFVRALFLAFVLVVSVPVVLSVQGCQSLESLSFDQRLKLSIDTHTEVVRAVTRALQAGHISVADAERFQKIAVNSREILDAAVALRGSDLSSAEGQLQLANDLLLRLQDYLAEKEGG